MQKENPVVVIGAGPAGLGTGLALGQHGIVLESSSDIGGICRTIEWDGAVFDLGGHSFHTPHPQVRELVFGALDMYEQKREARCYSHGRVIDYPFQRHYQDLMLPDVIRECEEGLSTTQDAKGSPDFEDFINRRFGAGIAKHFMLPYNQKLWGPNLKRMAADWTGERVASAKNAKESFDQSGGKRKPLQSDTHVAYPSKGGFGEIMVALAKRLPDLRLAKKVVGIDPSSRTMRMLDGSEIRWQQIVSTLPITQLLTLLPNVPDSLQEDANQLEALSLAVVLIVVGHPVDTPIQRFYCADPDIPAHKVAINHNSSPYLRSLPHHGIMAEVSYCEDKPSPGTDLEEKTIQGLLKFGVIQSRSEIRGTKVIDVKYGYPVPSHDRDAIVFRLKSWLATLGIHTVGRFGEWAYINSDEALHRGLTLGANIAIELDKPS